MDMATLEEKESGDPFFQIKLIFVAALTILMPVQVQAINDENVNETTYPIISWDIFGKNGTYELYRDNVIVNQGNWTQIEFNLPIKLEYQLSELSKGNYTFTLITIDDNNNSFSKNINVEYIKIFKTTPISNDTIT